MAYQAVSLTRHPAPGWTQFDPTRWERRFSNPSVDGWAGLQPDRISGLYPNEVATDFAFLPFGGGQRKCVGDQFAIMEATVVMAMLLQKYEFTFTGKSDDVGMRTGATIHTMNGLNMIPREKGARAVREGEAKRGGYWAEKCPEVLEGPGMLANEEGVTGEKLDPKGCPFHTDSPPSQ